MYENLSVSVAPLSKAELSAMRAVARCERGVHAFASDAVRLGVLRCSSIGRLDADACAGLALLEADMLLGLAREPARSVRELRAKARIFRARLADDEGADNLRAILFAAVGADARRLGVSVDDAGGRA